MFPCDPVHSLGKTGRGLSVKTASSVMQNFFIKVLVSDQIFLPNRLSGKDILFYMKHCSCALRWKLVNMRCLKGAVSLGQPNWRV